MEMIESVNVNIHTLITLNYMKGSRPHPNYIKEWKRFSGLYNQGLTDWANIKMREREAKEGMG